MTNTRQNRFQFKTNRLKHCEGFEAADIYHDRDDANPMIQDDSKNEDAVSWTLSMEKAKEHITKSAIEVRLLD